MDIKQELKAVINKHKDDKLQTFQTDISAMANDCLVEIESLENEIIMYKAKLNAFKIKNKKYFEYELYARKNGTKFIKVLIYSNEQDGYVEVARVNLSKNEWVQNNLSVEDVWDDLKD